MNEKMKERINSQNKQIVTKLSDSFGVKVYQDDVGEDEEKNYHFFVFETGSITAGESEERAFQDVFVHYVSENVEDLDERTLDIISLLQSIKFRFVRTEKERYQKGDTDAYVDRVSVLVRRMIKFDHSV